MSRQGVIPDTSGRKPRSFRELDEQLTREWDGYRDHGAALRTARHIALKVELRSSTPELQEDFVAVDHAVTVMLARPDDLVAPDLRREARRLAEGWRKLVESVLRANPTIEPLAIRVRSDVLSARVEFADGEPRRAFGFIRGARRRLIDAVGGAGNLAAAVGCPEPNTFGHLLFAVNELALRIYGAEFARREPLRTQLLDPLVQEMISLFCTLDIPAAYERAHGAIVQTRIAAEDRPQLADTWVLERLAAVERALGAPAK